MSMPKRSSNMPKNTELQAIEQPTNDPTLSTGGKNPAAVALGRLGGKKGGLARAKKLTAEQRREIAKKAAEARWRKKKRS